MKRHIPINISCATDLELHKRLADRRHTAYYISLIQAEINRRKSNEDAEMTGPQFNTNASQSNSPQKTNLNQLTE